MMTLISRGRAAALAFALGAAVLATPAIGATDVTDIGSLDQAALAALPQFQAANKSLSDYGGNLQKQYLGRAKNASQATQQKLAAEFQGKMADKQRQLFGPLFAKAQAAIASVASSKNLTVVVDKRIVVFGGQDITPNVRDLLTGIGDPVPPQSTPGPSKVGYVDQAAVDGTPKIKSAQDQFVKFRQDQDNATRERLRSAKTDADREAIYKDYRKALDDKQNQVLKPVIDTTRSVIGDVAKSKGLILVVDKGNIVFGGMDITKDVTDKLK